MDKESISRLDLDFIKNIDLDKLDELYVPSTNNYIIKLKLNKDDSLYCPHSGLANSCFHIGAKSQLITILTML